MLFLPVLALAASVAAHAPAWANHIPHKLQKRDVLAAFPADGQVYLGGWPNGQQGYSDTPAAMNARLNLSLPVYQIGQRIPLHPYDYVAGEGWPAFTYLIDATNTNANYFITVYADEGIPAVTDGDLVALANQVQGYSASGRQVYLRFLPEMQGAWNVYGLQPIEYIALWKRMYTIIKEIAPSTVIVWSPNLAPGYPYGTTLDQVNSTANKQALDTNNDGQLTVADDAYAPYFPGADFVDASGISIYYKGPNYSNQNVAQPGGFCEATLNGIDPYNPQIQATPFYSTYCQDLGTPCVISEVGAAYHVNVSGGVRSQRAIQKAFVADCIANATFLDAFPKIKMINVFEQEKLEVDGNGEDLRDFRVSNVSAVAVDFVSAVNALSDRFAWATPTSYPGGGFASGTAMPTTNPVLVGTEARTQVVSGLTETVTWTYTSYSSPTPVLVSQGVSVASASGSASTGGVLAAAGTDSSSASTSMVPLLLAGGASVACVLMGGLLL